MALLALGGHSMAAFRQTSEKPVSQLFEHHRPVGIGAVERGSVHCCETFLEFVNSGPSGNVVQTGQTSACERQPG